MAPIEKLMADLNEKIGDKNILTWSRFLATNDNRAFRVKHPGTLFKLYLLYQYLRFPYIPIMQKLRSQIKSRKLVYIDAFSGNGLNSLKSKGSEIYVLGSSILATLAWYKFDPDSNFDQMILIDKRPTNVELLKQRISDVTTKLGLSQKYTIDSELKDSTLVHVIKEDIRKSSFVSSIANYLDRYLSKFNFIHVMFFFDPGNPRSLTAATLKTLLVFPGDLILLLHPGIFSEMYNKGRYKSSTLQEMLGAEIDLEKLKKYDTKQLQIFYVKTYCDLIRTIIMKVERGSNVRNVIIPVDIRTRAGHYVLVIATRTTGGKDSVRWQQYFQNLALEIAKLSDSGEVALKVLLGEQDQITHF